MCMCSELEEAGPTVSFDKYVTKTKRLAFTCFLNNIYTKTFAQLSYHTQEDDSDPPLCPLLMEANLVPFLNLYRERKKIR